MKCCMSICAVRCGATYAFFRADWQFINVDAENTTSHECLVQNGKSVHQSHFKICQKVFPNKRSKFILWIFKKLKSAIQSFFCFCFINITSLLILWGFYIIHPNSTHFPFTLAVSSTQTNKQNIILLLHLSHLPNTSSFFLVALGAMLYQIV